MNTYEQQKTHVKSDSDSYPPPRRHRRRRRRRWPWAIFILTIITVALILIYHSLVSKPQIPADVKPSQTSAAAQETADQQFLGSQDTVERKKDFFTILVSGVDDGNGGSDTIILVAFDAGNGAIHCVSIPRDTGVFINGKTHRINSAYNLDGTKKLAETVSKLLGIPVDFSVEVNLKGFVELVDTINGVNFNVPINMNYDDPSQDLFIHVNKGMQHLDGQDALGVVRFRHNNDGSGYGTEDLGRIGTQQAFLKAVIQQTLTLSNLDKILHFAEIFQKYVDTDLTPGNLAWFGKAAITIGSDKITFSTLDGEWKSPYYRLDKNAVLALVNSSLNPYKTDRTAGDLSIPS